jgi:hypothetical protein
MPERNYHQPNGRVVTSRERGGVPGTPSRRDKSRESSALQDPGLKDYVRRHGPSVFSPAEPCSMDTKADSILASRGVPGQGSLRVCLQGFQLGHGRSCGRQANQTGRPAQERTADD